MKGTSKVIMGATLVVVLSLAIVLGLVLVLLAELYCSILLRRRRLKTSKTSNTTTAAVANTYTSQTEEPPGPPLSSFYSQGVLHAPRSFLFPKLPSKREQVDDVEKHHCKFRHFLSIQTQELNAKQSQPQPRLQKSPSPSYMPLCKPGASTEEPILEVLDRGEGGGDRDPICGGGIGQEQLVYISNPIYDNDATRPDTADAIPFESPDTSPSRLEMGGSSGDDENVEQPPPFSSSSAMTPPLTPMKELPAKACSVALRDAGSVATSGSDSNSQNGAFSSSSGTPSTSPSW
ncbi:hypothetical protein Ancab_028727 [Ancistrocladus abbreviatus]